MTNYDIEVGEDSRPSTCGCCGRQSCIGHGFVYKDGDARAIYYAGWSDEHPEKMVTLAVAIGEWEEGSTRDRTCFGLEVRDDGERTMFRVIDPECSPWASTRLMGEMITRKKGLGHDLLKEVFAIAEEIVSGHTPVGEYLGLL